CKARSRVRRSRASPRIRIVWGTASARSLRCTARYASALDRIQDGLRDMSCPPGEGARRHEIAVEDARQRVAVGEIEIALAGNRDVELHRIDARAKEPLTLAAAQDGAQRFHQRRMQLAHSLRVLHVAALVQVFAVEQR